MAILIVVFCALFPVLIAVAMISTRHYGKAGR
jgi:hypothetical protein